MPITSGMMSSNRHDWETPQDLFDDLNAEFHFTLDVCATAKSAKCERYFTPDEDGLQESWRDKVCWMNPPFGKEIPAWICKAYYESQQCTVVCLIPVRSDTRNWYEYVMRASEIRFIADRCWFTLDGVKKKRAPFPSAIVVFKATSRSPKISTYILPHRREANPT